MTVYTDRLYSGEADLHAMIDLLLAVRPAAHLADYPGAGDLREWLELPDTRVNTRLWHNARGQLAAFASVDLSRGYMLFEVAPHEFGGEIEAQMIAWSVERMRRSRYSECTTLDTSCRDDNAARIALLERHGFVIQAERTLRMVRRLDEPIPAPRLPAGFNVRHVAGEREVEAYVALHRAAFGTQNMTVERRLAIMRAPDYDAELDLIAVAPDGAWAGFCVCQINREENARTRRNEGWTEPVGTHPEFRQRGLARALLLTGLSLLKQRGVDAALLGTSSANVAMQRAAESVGFRPLSTIAWFSKPIFDT
ncbi:MAG: GNAT family N-acetyltransferase [Anaerolineae bacterium]